MLIKPNGKSLAVVLCALGLFGCATAVSQTRIVKEVAFAGHYNEINGTLSDGSVFTGKGWFTPGTTRGDFCLQSQEMVCSGKYSATLAKRIKGEFVCSNGMTGNYVSERIADGDFVVPVNASGSLSDGRTATAVFSPIKEGNASTTCFVP